MGESNVAILSGEPVGRYALRIAFDGAHGTSVVVGIALRALSRTKAKYALLCYLKSDGVGTRQMTGHDLRVRNPRFPDDSASADRVLSAAAALGFQLDDFANCLSLFEHLQAHLKEFKHTGPQDDHELLQRSGWRIVATKQAAMTLWHFRKALDELREAVNADPAIRDLADTKRIKRAIETTFRSKFPDWEDMRFGVAHTAEMIAKYDKHAAPGPVIFGGVKTDMPILGSALAGDTYTMTIDGQERSCEVSRKTLEALELIAEECRQSLENPDL